jgi:hypothetical protein
MKLTALAALVALAVGLSACGGPATLSKEDVAKEAQAQLDAVAQENGQESFPKITCPDDLKAEKGATTRCTAATPDGELGITAEVTDVKDDKAQLHFQADDQITK